MENKREKEKSITIIINELQLLLAEKRTLLSYLRTGIAIFAIPISVLSFLIVLSKYYNIFKALKFLVPLLLINLFLIILASYLILKAITRLHICEKRIEELKKDYVDIAKLLE